MGLQRCKTSPEGTGFPRSGDIDQVNIELMHSAVCQFDVSVYAERSLPAQKDELIGEDAAYFDVEQQSTGKWVFFTVELAVVLGIMYVVRHSNTVEASKH